MRGVSVNNAKMSQKSIPAKLEFAVCKPYKRSKNEIVCEIKECSKKKVTCEIQMEKTKEKIYEAQKANSTKDDKDDKAIHAKVPEEIPVKNIKLIEATPEATKVCEALKNESPKVIKLETSAESPHVTKILEIPKTESTKNVKDDKLAIPTKDSEESYVKNTKPIEDQFEELIKVQDIKKESSKDIEDDKLKTFIELTSDTLMSLDSLSLSTEVLETQKTESIETVKDNNSEISPQDPEESNVKDIKPAEDENKTKKIPVLRKVVQALFEIIL